MTGEFEPQVVGYRLPEAVLFQPWVVPTVTAVEVRIGPDEWSGSKVTMIAYADQAELPPGDRQQVRYRLGTLFGAALREWVDEPRR